MNCVCFSHSYFQAFRGTVKPYGAFNANDDANALQKAMKGLGTDEDTIMKLLTARSNVQRQQIKAAYKTLFGKDLVDHLKSELGGKFESLIVGLMTAPIAYDAELLRHAIKGAGTDEKVLIEILASRTPDQVKEIIATYKNMYDHDLEHDVTGDTGGHFRRMLVILLQASRQQGVQEGTIESDAKALFAAGEQKFGTDEEQFITILGNRSAAHLQRVFAAYMKLSGFEIEESIQRETSGSLEKILLAVVKCARSVPAYFAECLYHSMKGAGTDDETLIRIMVTRSEVDMLDIRKEFRRMFATSLHAMIKGDTAGDYRKSLVVFYEEHLCNPAMSFYAFRGTVKPYGAFNANDDANALQKAMKGLGTDEDTIMKLLTARSNVQRQQIKAAYKTLFGKDLVDHLKSELGGKFESLIVGLMTAPIAYDAELLRHAIKGAGTDEKVLIEILASRTPDQVKEIIATYKNMYDHDLEHDVTGDTGGHFRRMLVILLQVRPHLIIKCARSVPAYFAECLYHSMKGAGTDDETLIRIMVTRSEVDMLDIRKEFRRMFATSLHAMIKGDTSGDYRKCLLLLCGGED
uniref:Annexin n=1 Tax=Denticeps clupeoides TaxID=299321 RepID=A0AAY4AA80_9TELE